jgi:hypothetical protein
MLKVDDPRRVLEVYPHLLYIEGENNPLLVLRNRKQFDMIKEIVGPYLKDAEFFPILRELWCNELRDFLPGTLTSCHEIDYLLEFEAVEKVVEFWKKWVKKDKGLLSSSMDAVKNPEKFARFIELLSLGDIDDFVQRHGLYMCSLPMCKELVRLGYKASNVEFMEILREDDAEPGRFELFYGSVMLSNLDIPETLTYKQMCMLHRLGYRSIVEPGLAMLTDEFFLFLQENGTDMLKEPMLLFRCCARCGKVRDFLRYSIEIPRNACKIVSEYREQYSREYDKIINELIGRGAEPYRMANVVRQNTRDDVRSPRRGTPPKR